MAALEGAFGGLFVPGAPLGAAWWFFDLPGGLWGAPVGLLVGLVFGAWLGHRRLTRTRWRLDAQGLGLRPFPACSTWTCAVARWNAARAWPR